MSLHYAKLYAFHDIFKAATFYMTTSALQQIGIYKSHHKKSYHSATLNVTKF